jgi:hypothetical protein
LVRTLDLPATGRCRIISTFRRLLWKFVEMKMTKQNMKIELLYFDDCPSWQNALEILYGSLNQLGISQEVSLIPVETQDEAVKNEFTGSPMIRVNGADLFPTGQTNYALGCRVYQTPEGFKGWPNEKMILEKLGRLMNWK